MKDLIKLTNIVDEEENPIYVMKNKILFMTRVKDKYTSISMIFSYGTETVKELPEDINKDVNLLKFTSYETGSPVYIAKDGIIGFEEDPDQAEVTRIILVYPMSQSYIIDKTDQKEKYLNGLKPYYSLRPYFRVRVKESPEQVKKIIQLFDNKYTPCTTSKWEVISVDADGVLIKCEKCDRLVRTESPDAYYFCPKCGAKMINV